MFRVIIATILITTAAFSLEKPIEFQDWPLKTQLGDGDSVEWGGPDGITEVTGPTTIEWEYDEATQLLSGNDKLLNPFFVTQWELTEEGADNYYTLYPRVKYLVDEEGFDKYAAVALYEDEVARVTEQAREAYASKYLIDPPHNDEWHWLSDRKPFLESLCAVALRDTIVASAEVMEEDYKYGSYISLRFKGAEGLSHTIQLYSAAKREEMRNAPKPERPIEMSPAAARRLVQSLDAAFKCRDARISLVDGFSIEFH